MKKTTAAERIAAVAVVLGITLAGCSSEKKTAPTESKQTTSSSSSSSSSSTTTSSKASSTKSPQASGPNYTIVDYIRDNKIVESQVKRGDASAPALNLPFPQGWEDAGGRTPDWAYGAILFTDPQYQEDPPSIIALYSKLTGNVDPKKILEYAPGELKNLPSYEVLNEGKASQLGGFDAIQAGGTYMKDGKKRVIAQKTVVVPGQDGLYVLQLNADAVEDAMGPLMTATDVIDNETKIG